MQQVLRGAVSGDETQRNALSNGKSPTNTDVFALVNSVRLELKGDISSSFGTISKQQGELNQRFETLELGRIAKIETKQAAIDAKLAMFGLFVVVLQILINLYFRK